MEMTLVRLAARTAWRSKRTSLLLILSIGLGVGCLVFMRALQDGFVRQRLDAGLGLATGHLVVSAPEGSAGALDSVPDGAALAAALEQDVDVVAAAPRVVFDGFLKAPQVSRGVIVFGVDAEAESRTLQVADRLVEGAFLPAWHERDVPPAALGRALANQIGVGVGERVALLVEGRDGALVARTLRIGGLFETGAATFDERTLYVPRSVATAMLLLAGDAGEVVARVRAPLDADEVAARVAVRPEFAGLRVRSWHAVSPETFETLEVLESVARLRSIILFALVGLGIFNTVTMTAFHRRREFGVLLAMGMRPAVLLRTLAWETAGVSSVALLAGLAGSWAVTELWFGRTGIDLTALGARLPGALEGTRVIYPVFQFDAFVAAALWALAVALLVLTIPAFKVLRLDPAEVVR